MRRQRRNLPRGGEHKGERVLGDGMGGDAGGVRDDDIRFFRCSEIDMIRSRPPDRKDFEFFGLGEKIRVEPASCADVHDGLGVFDTAEEFFRPLAVAGMDRHLA